MVFVRTYLHYKTLISIQVMQLAQTSLIPLSLIPLSTLEFSVEEDEGMVVQMQHTRRWKS